MDERRRKSTRRRCAPLRLSPSPTTTKTSRSAAAALVSNMPKRIEEEPNEVSTEESDGERKQQTISKRKSYNKELLNNLKKRSEDCGTTTGTDSMEVEQDEAKKSDTNRSPSTDAGCTGTNEFRQNALPVTKVSDGSSLRSHSGSFAENWGMNNLTEEGERLGLNNIKEIISREEVFNEERNCNKGIHEEQKQVEGVLKDCEKEIIHERDGELKKTSGNTDNRRKLGKEEMEHDAMDVVWNVAIDVKRMNWSRLKGDHDDNQEINTEKDDSMIVESLNNNGKMNEIEVISNEDVFNKDMKNIEVVQEDLKSTKTLDEVGVKQDQPLAVRKAKRGGAVIDRFSPSPEPLNHHDAHVTDASAVPQQKDFAGAVDFKEKRLKRSRSRSQDGTQENVEMTSETANKDNILKPLVDSKNEASTSQILSDERLKAYLFLVTDFRLRRTPENIDEIKKIVDDMEKAYKMASFERKARSTTTGNENSAAVAEMKDENLEQTYEAARLVDCQHNPVSINDRAFILSWKEWKVSTSTAASLVDLRGCEDVINDYVRYLFSSNKVITQLKNCGADASRPHLELPPRSLYNKDFLHPKYDKMSISDAQIAHWRIKEIEHNWNEIIEKDQPLDFTAVRLDDFLCSGLRPPDFQYITKNVVSQKAEEKMAALANRKKKCDCTCGQLCLSCHAKINLAMVLFNGNTVVAHDDDAWKEHSFAALKCSDDKLCDCSRKWPRRTVRLLVTNQLQVKGLGVFAVDIIEQGVIIAEFVGWIRADKEAHFGDFTWEYSLTGGFILSTERMGNELRFLNHSCDPNAAPLQIFEGTGTSVPRLFVCARRRINPGEEILVDYHPSRSSDERKPTVSGDCQCKADNCRGSVW